MSDRRWETIGYLILALGYGVFCYMVGAIVEHKAVDRWWQAHERTGFLVYKGGKLDRLEATTNHATMLANEDWRAITIPAPNQLPCCKLTYDQPAPAGIGKPQAPAEHQNSFKIPNTIIYPIRCINQLTGEDLPWRKNAKGELVCAAAHPLKLGKRKASEPPSESGYCVEGLAGVPTPQVPQ